MEGRGFRSLPGSLREVYSYRHQLPHPQVVSTRSSSSLRDKRRRCSWISRIFHYPWFQRKIMGRLALNLRIRAICSYTPLPKIDHFVWSYNNRVHIYKYIYRFIWIIIRQNSKLYIYRFTQNSKFHRLQRNSFISDYIYIPIPQNKNSPSAKIIYIPIYIYTD